CFIFPSLYEGFGLPVLEAMAAGTPVVASRVGAIPEVAGDAALLVDARRPAELAEAIETGLPHAGPRARRIAPGPGRARLVTWEAVARQTLEVYESVQAGRGRVAAAGAP